MLAVNGYYDGVAIKTLEDLDVKPNQMLIITVMDDFIEPAENIQKKSMRGILAEYADQALIEKEKGAWEHAMVEKYGNT